MSRPRRITTPLEELERSCGGCGHQNAVHTGGADRSGWALYDPVWANATGWCNTVGCDCPGRAAAARVADDMPVRGDAA